MTRGAVGVLRRARDAAYPAYETALATPIREGRLRLDGLRGAELQLALFGVVVLAGLLASLVLGDIWRRDDLLPVVSVGRYHAVPEALLPATLVALFVAWVVFLWGATLASNVVTAIGAVLFLLLNATIGRPLAVRTPGAPSFVDWGPEVTRVAYVAVPAVMALSILISLRPRWQRRARVPLFAALVASLFVFFGSLLALHAVQLREGLTLSVPPLLDGSFESLRAAFVPVLAIAGIAVVELGYNLSGGAAAPLWRRAALAAKVFLAALIAVKLWVQLVERRDDWLPESDDAVRAALSVAFALVLFAGFALLARGPRPFTKTEGAKERLILGGAVAFAAPVLAVLVLATLTVFFLVQARWIGAADLLDEVPTDWIGDHGAIIVWPLVLLLAVLLVVGARRRGANSELGLALLLLSLWVLPTPILDELGERRGFNESLFDVVFTIGVGVWLAVRWRTVDAVFAAQLAAIVIFAWLVSARADMIYLAFGYIGLPAVALVVIGIVFSLLADCAFTAGDSRHFPRVARPLLWIGYLLLSITLLNWTEVTHAVDVDLSAGAAENGFFLIGIPLAVWLVVRRPFGPPRA